MLCCQGFEVKNYDFILGALPMKYSDSCKNQIIVRRRGYEKDE